MGEEKKRNWSTKYYCHRQILPTNLEGNVSNPVKRIDMLRLFLLWLSAAQNIEILYCPRVLWHIIFSYRIKSQYLRELFQR